MRMGMTNGKAIVLLASRNFIERLLLFAEVDIY
jgi:hypothetical protein